MSVRVVSLGDSISCGEGVGLSVPLDRTWPALLARGVPGGVLLPLARAGARVQDVRGTQLGPALAAEPHLATVLIGLNDVSRGGFCPEAFDSDLSAVVTALGGTGATVLLGRLHDPCRHLPLPQRLRQAVTARLVAVNAAVDRAAAQARAAGGTVHLLDLDAVPALRLRPAWAVDRVHPTGEAHALVAVAAAEVLVQEGFPVTPPVAGALPQRAPGVLQAAWWTARHGLPWLASRHREVLGPALALAR